MYRRTALATLLLLVLAAPASALRLDPPALSAIGASRTSITLGVTAGGTGAPAGFVVEWMSAADFQRSGGWPGDAGAFEASDFTGQATLHVAPGDGGYRLVPGEPVQVVIGRLFDETGVTASDYGELPEGASFVFRARALATADYEASQPSPTLESSTTPPGVWDCTLTVGFWKNHPESWARVASLVLGAVSYDQAELAEILARPARGNGLVSLAHQLIATKLNLLLGVVPGSEVAAAIAQADALIGSRIVPPSGTDTLDPAQTGGLVALLDVFNGGTLGPGHCSDGSVLPSRTTTWARLKILFR